MVAIVFFWVSIAAIRAVGLLSAFSARRPTRLSAWAAAYLVLVVGLIQAGLITAWYQLGCPGPALAAAALVLYNVGSGAVLAGTILHARRRYAALFVNAGGALIGVAMVGLLWTAARTALSPLHTLFIALTVVILVSMPIGLILSHKRHHTGAV